MVLITVNRKPYEWKSDTITTEQIKDLVEAPEYYVVNVRVPECDDPEVHPGSTLSVDDNSEFIVRNPRTVAS